MLTQRGDNIYVSVDQQTRSRTISGSESGGGCCLEYAIYVDFLR